MNDHLNWGNSKEFSGKEWTVSWKERCLFRNTLWTLANELGIDGFLDTEDCIEVCLFNAIECVGNYYTILPCPEDECKVGHEGEKRELKLTK